MSAVQIAVTVIFLLSTIIALSRASQTWTMFRYGARRTAIGTQTIIIPVLNCPDLAMQAVEHFKNEINVVFVGSARDKLSTVPALIKAGARVICAPIAFEGKSAQIQWALSVLPETDWVTVYDVDSRPRRHSLEYFSKSSVKGDPDVIARLSSYQSASHRGFFEGFALRQSWWCVKFERQMWSQRRFWYLVGHGVSVRWYLFESYLDPDPVSEDLSLGYRLSRLNRHICVGTDIDNSLSVDTVRMAILQAAQWFTGEWEATRILPFFAGLLRRIEVLMSWGGIWLLLVSASVFDWEAFGAILIAYSAHTTVTFAVSSRIRTTQEFDLHCVLGFFARDIIFGLGLLLGLFCAFRGRRVYSGATRHSSPNIWAPRYSRLDDSLACEGNEAHLGNSNDSVILGRARILIARATSRCIPKHEILCKLSSKEATTILARAGSSFPLRRQKAQIRPFNGR